MTCIRRSITCLTKLRLLGLLALAVTQPAWSQCSATPQAALADYQAGGTDSAKAKTDVTDGFRIWKTQREPSSGREWFWVVACGVSSKPAQLLWAPLRKDQRQQIQQQVQQQPAPEVAALHAATLPRGAAVPLAVAPPPPPPATAPARGTGEDHRLIHVGDTVLVMQTSDAFSMRLQGLALQGGELGAKVQVQVNAWNKVTVLSGKVTGKDEVRISD